MVMQPRTSLDMVMQPRTSLDMVMQPRTSLVGTVTGFAIQRFTNGVMDPYYMPCVQNNGTYTCHMCIRRRHNEGNHLKEFVPCSNLPANPSLVKHVNM